MIQKDWIDLEECPTDIWDIEMKVRQFYITLESYDDIEEKKTILIKCLGILNSARTLLKNLLMPEDNDYLEKQDIAYKWMVDNLNRADKRIAENQKTMIDQVENARLLNTNLGKSSKIDAFETILIEYLEHLVYYPIKKAYMKFLNFHEEKDGQKIKKDEKLFLYFVFLELYHASEVLGGIAREELRTSPKGHGVSNLTPSTHIPVKIPSNVETEEIIEDENEDEDETDSDVTFDEDFFKDDYDDE